MKNFFPSKNKWALVTGAAGGIGISLVQTFAQHGYSVLAIDLLPQPVGFAGDQYLQLDLEKLVTDPSHADQAWAQINRILDGQGLDVLVNNAAVQLLGGVESLSMADWQRSLNVNVIAPFALVQGLLPSLEKVEGCVVNISSIHARLTKANFLAYATSKAALSGMTRAMAVDLGCRVRVNAIEPAAIATDMLLAGFVNDPEKFAQLERCHPQNCIGKPSQVASLALSIVSGELRFLHGTCIGLDGGISGRLFDPV